MPQEQQERTRSEQANAIATYVVRVTAEYTGRGPTKARTYLEDDLVTVVLSDTLTKGERSLVRDGQGDTVVAMRKTYQRTMASVLIEGIERITCRQVVAFLSDNHIEPDIAIESFVLARRTDSQSIADAEHADT